MEKARSTHHITAVFQLGGDNGRYDAAMHDGFRFELPGSPAQTEIFQVSYKEPLSPAWIAAVHFVSKKLNLIFCLRSYCKEDRYAETDLIWRAVDRAHRYRRGRCRSHCECERREAETVIFEIEQVDHARG